MVDTPSELILSLLKEKPKGLTIEEVSRELNLNRTTVAKYLNSLVISGQADLRELGRAKLFYLSRRVPLAYVIDLLSDLILILDREHVIIEANTALLDGFALSRESLLKQRLEQTPLNSNLSEDFYAAVNRALEGKGSIYDIPLKREGTLRYFKTRFIPLVLHEGGQGIAIILEDITETKLNQFDLEEGIRQRTEALARANVQLVKKIDEHQQTLTALRESEAKYRCIVETANEGIWVGDSSFTIITCNRKLAEILGYSQPDDIIGINISSFIFPEDLPHHFQKIADRAKGVKETYERRLFRKDGSACWVLVSATPVMNADGSFNSSFEMFTDITAQKQLETELEKKSRYYEQLLQISTDAIHVMDVEGNLREWNAAFLKHLGYSPAEAATLNVRDWDVYNHCDNLRSKLEWPEYSSGIRFDTHHRTKQGVIKDVEIYAVSVVINGETMLYASARDITERKKNERARKEQADWTRSVATTTGGMLWEVDENGLYRFYSQSVETITGYSLDEIINKLHYYEIFLHPDRETIRVAAEKIIAAHKPFRSFKNRIVHKDGHILHLETNAVPIFDPDGTFRGYRGIDLVVGEDDRVPDSPKKSVRKMGSPKKSTRLKKKD